MDQTESISRELRLALVMNGGISLAVWMAGVTYELDNLRLATRPTGMRRQASAEAWAAISDTAKINIAVDLVAGASAGGLNGTVLARSIALNRELPRLKDLWLDRASLSFGKLLGWPPSKPGVSVLNGDYFHREVCSLLAEASHAVPPIGSQPPTVTLLVTATALPIKGDRTAKGKDSGVDDSRRVYRFASRRGLEGGFGDIDGLPTIPDVQDFGDVETLALAARASASFPIAFQPVPETSALQRQQFHETLTDDRWLMDGGVLDNAPFEPVLDELRSRAVGAAFERVILYINPSTAVAPRRRKCPRTGPGILTTVVGLVSAWREPDRRLDKEGLDDARLAAQFTASKPHEVLAHLYQASSDALTAADLSAAATALFSHYQTTAQQALEIAASGDVSTADAAHNEPAAPPPGFVPASLSASDSDGWQWGLPTADRILRWWGRALRTTSTTGQHPAAFEALAPAQQIVQHWLDLLRSTQSQQAGDPARWYSASRAFMADHDKPKLLDELVSRTADFVANALHGPSGQQLLQSSLELEVVTGASSPGPARAGDVMPFSYWEVTPDSPDPYDLAPRSLTADTWAAKKLYGERWGHFGAFASKEGRAWDWMWGRLDAAMSISAELLKMASVPQDEWPALQQPLAEAILTEEHTTKDDLQVRGGAIGRLSGLTLLLEWAGILRRFGRRMNM